MHLTCGSSLVKMPYFFIKLKNLEDPYLKDFMDALVSQYEGEGKETLQSISDETIDKVFKGKVILA